MMSGLIGIPLPWINWQSGACTSAWIKSPGGIQTRESPMTEAGLRHRQGAPLPHATATSLPTNPPRGSGKGPRHRAFGVERHVNDY
jgi:hypothetical protein